MQLGHLLTRSGLTYPKVSPKVYHDSFCQSDSSVSLPWVIYFEAFYLHVVSSFSYFPVICPKFVLFLTPLQFAKELKIAQICGCWYLMQKRVSVTVIMESIHRRHFSNHDSSQADFVLSPGV